MSFRVNLEIISSKSGDAYHISGLTTALESGRKRQKKPQKTKKRGTAHFQQNKLPAVYE